MLSMRMHFGIGVGGMHRIIRHVVVRDLRACAAGSLVFHDDSLRPFKGLRPAGLRPEGPGKSGVDGMMFGLPLIFNQIGDGRIE